MEYHPRVVLMFLSRLTFQLPANFQIRAAQIPSPVYPCTLAPNMCGSPIWDVLHVTNLTLGILR